MMSLLGSMMKGSGLEEALENAYGANAVTHMISGKAVSRVLRRYFLIEAALMSKLMLRVLPHMDNENNTVNPSGRLQETMEESILDKVVLMICTVLRWMYLQIIHLKLRKSLQMKQAMIYVCKLIRHMCLIRNTYALDKENLV